MRALLKTSCLGLALVGVGSAPSWAGGLYINEFATPSLGVAGAGREAIAVDASTNSAIANPAGMTRLHGTSILVGAGLLFGKAKFKADDETPFSGGNGGNQVALAPLLGSHGVYSITDDLKVGMSVFSLSGAALDPDNDWTGRYQNQVVSLLTLTANPSVAYRVNDWLSLGAGVTMMYANIDYKLAARAINPPDGGTGRVKVDGDDFAFGYNFGALFELSPRTRIGVTYISKVEPNFSGDLKLEPGEADPFSVGSNLEFTYPQFVRIGAYHEFNDQWAVLGTVGWEDWSSFDTKLVSTKNASASIPTEWRDTYHYSAGVHYRPHEDWLLQAGVTYDTSPVSKDHRTADMPVDRQIRVAVGAQYQWSERVNVGGALEYMDLGDSKIDSDALVGKFSANRLFMVAVNLSYQF